MDALNAAKGTLAELVAGGALPAFEESGRYQAVTRPSRLPDPQRQIIHYAMCRGRLYRDDDAWRAAYQLVHSFTVGGGKRIRMEPLFTVFEDVDDPGYVLLLLAKAFETAGAQSVGRGADGRSARFSLTRSATVADLPEPYGTWLQIKGERPAWRDRRELTVEIACDVEILPDEAKPTQRNAIVNATLSTLPLPLLRDAAAQLTEDLYGAVGLPGAVSLAGALTDPAQVLQLIVETTAEWTADA